MMPRLALTAALLLAAATGRAPDARAEDFGAIVVTRDAAEILVSDMADTPRAPHLAGEALLLLLGARDIAAGTVDAETSIRLGPGRSGSLMTGLQAVALGAQGYRAPMAGVAAQLGRDAETLSRRLADLARRVGMTGSSVSISADTDGAPRFTGTATLRDIARIATAFDALPRVSAEIFGPATGYGAPDIWMHRAGSCLLARIGPATGRPLAAAMTGAPDVAACFGAASRNILAQDARLADGAGAISRRE